MDLDLSAIGDAFTAIAEKTLTAVGTTVLPQIVAAQLGLGVKPKAPGATTPAGQASQPSSAPSSPASPPPTQASSASTAKPPAPAGWTNGQIAMAAGLGLLALGGLVVLAKGGL